MPSNYFIGLTTFSIWPKKSYFNIQINVHDFCKSISERRNIIIYVEIFHSWNNNVEVEKIRGSFTKFVQMKKNKLKLDSILLNFEDSRGTIKLGLWVMHIRVSVKIWQILTTKLCFSMLRLR